MSKLLTSNQALAELDALLLDLQAMAVAPSLSTIEVTSHDSLPHNSNKSPMENEYHILHSGNPPILPISHIPPNYPDYTGNHYHLLNQHSGHLQSKLSNGNNDYEMPIQPSIYFPSPPPLSPNSDYYTDPPTLNVLNQEMSGTAQTNRMSSQKSGPPKIKPKPQIPDKPPNTVSTPYMQSSTITSLVDPEPYLVPSQLIEMRKSGDKMHPAADSNAQKPSVDLSKKTAGLDELDRLMESLNNMTGATTELKHTSNNNNKNYNKNSNNNNINNNINTNNSNKTNYNDDDIAQYDYPELPFASTQASGIVENLYESIPDKFNDKLVSYVEVTPRAEVSAPDTAHQPVRPIYPPNTKTSERLQGIDNLMAKLEGFKSGKAQHISESPKLPARNSKNSFPEKDPLIFLPPGPLSSVNRTPYSPHSKISHIPTDECYDTLYGGDNNQRKSFPTTDTTNKTSRDHSSQLTDLETMVGILENDATKQGVETDPQGVCAACKMPILTGIVTALGLKWHLDHFTCVVCDAPLAHVTFYESNGKPYCEKDYQELFAPKCAYCNGSILESVIKALNNTWHPEHFFCAKCGKPFGDEGFHEHKGKAYCMEDFFENFAPKCTGCESPIMAGYISAMNGHWHSECFVCQVCHASFQGGNFFELQNKPYCELHYHAARGSLCGSCLKPVTGSCVTAMGKKYHPEHFTCAFCMKELDKGTFKEHSNKPYCNICFIKLFS